MSITENQIIWYPGIYVGRLDEEYIQIVGDISLMRLIELVQKRAQEDGEWAIVNDFVGDNEAKMRRMMEFVRNEKNIAQCVDHILKEDKAKERTVDWVCRDLANASKWVVK